MLLDHLQPGLRVTGVRPDAPVTLVAVTWHGTAAVEITYKDDAGTLGNELLYRDDEARLAPAPAASSSAFLGDGALFRLVAEAQRIRLAHLFDPVLAVHTSLVDALPHQITAVYDAMLPRQPLRFLLADDPGAGKTIMAGLLLRELIARSDVRRCLVVCPGGLLAEQWQSELDRRFHLPFEILTNENLEAARTGNWFLEHDLVIARLDKLARDEETQLKLQAPGAAWDLVVFDEAHKLSASLFGGEVKYTKRYRLGQLLAAETRHLLLMTATPHNGKEEDFQLFMALLDADRFEGKPANQRAPVADLMRRVVKEDMVTMAGKPLFPERFAHTLPYPFSPAEQALYERVTDYVRTEFNRAENLTHGKRGTIGFALTVLQRRLASSPEAIFQSLRRRTERLEARLRELDWQGAGEADPAVPPEDLDELEEAGDAESEAVVEEIADRSTAARTAAELQAEITLLRDLLAEADRLRQSGTDAKWVQLRGLLTQLLQSGDAALAPKLVIFTENWDTLDYLHRRIHTLFGKAEVVVPMHGRMGREERAAAQERFLNDPEARILLATDVAGEGLNLQRAHLMVNYDLPWNPNRIEQRFGRIHRIGQKEVCRLWNLVAPDTREGEVYQRVLEKLQEARERMGGQIFDVLGQLQFDGRPLRDLLLEAVRYGERPEVRAKLEQRIDGAFDAPQLQRLVADHALAHDVMDPSRVGLIAERMQRAEARRLQPHYIESFFLEAFRQLGGTIRQREPRRYQISHVPAVIRGRARTLGRRDAVVERYERVAFDKALLAPKASADDPSPPAAFLCPGHPLLDATLEVVLDRHRALLRQGAILVDDADPSTTPRSIIALEHAVQDASPRTISQRMLFIALSAKMPAGMTAGMTADGAQHLHYAPYLDYRPLRPDEPAPAIILARPECAALAHGNEAAAVEHAIATVGREHLEEVRERRRAQVAATRAAVQQRLTLEINRLDRQAQRLLEQERAGRPPDRLNSQEARRRADDLQARLASRLRSLDREEQVSALPPLVLGAFVVVPAGLLAALRGGAPAPASAPTPARDTQAAAARAREIVMAQERALGFEPADRELDKLGYDIESRDPRTGKLRFLEVKGRVEGAPTITVTRNEVLYSLNQPEAYILAVVEFLAAGGHRLHYIREPFRREPDFGATSVNYDFGELLARAAAPS